MNKLAHIALVCTILCGLGARADLNADKAKLASEKAKARAADTNLVTFQESFLKELMAYADEFRFVMERCRKSTDDEECRRRCNELKERGKTLVDQVTAVAPEEGKKAAHSLAKIQALEETIENDELSERLSRPFGYFSGRQDPKP